MRYEAYKVLHLFGIFTLLCTLGGSCLHAINGGTRRNNAARWLMGVLHGVGTTAVAAGGAGMLLRLEGVGWPWPGWVWSKVAIWTLLSSIVLLPYRRPGLARPMLLALPCLGGLAAWLAIYKPF